MRWAGPSARCRPRWPPTTPDHRCTSSPAPVRSRPELALIAPEGRGRLSPYCVYLPGGDPGRLDVVREGLAGVRDEGSQLVAIALTRATLDGPDGGRWLDLCAGPGGKAALLGSLAESRRRPPRRGGVSGTAPT